jgi:hypothetical protein
MNECPKQYKTTGMLSTDCDFSVVILVTDMCGHSEVFEGSATEIFD